MHMGEMRKGGAEIQCLYSTFYSPLNVCNYLDVQDSVLFDFYWEVWLDRSSVLWVGPKISVA